MNFRATLLGGAAIACTLGAFGEARGEAAPPPSSVEENDATRHPVAAQMRRLFEARLARDVGLDDAQIQSILPRVESIERSRARSLRERLGLLRELRRGLSSGMTDVELQRRLDALDRVGQETERATRATLAEIDRDLTVSQRVRLRFLMAQFRQEMARRVKEFGRGGAEGAAPHRRWRRDAPETDADRPAPDPTP